MKVVISPITASSYSKGPDDEHSQRLWELALGEPAPASGDGGQGEARVEGEGEWGGLYLTLGGNILDGLIDIQIIFGDMRL